MGALWSFVTKEWLLERLSNRTSVAYQNDFAYLDKCVLKYITETAPMPRFKCKLLHLCRRWKKQFKWGSERICCHGHWLEGYVSRINSRRRDFLWSRFRKGHYSEGTTDSLFDLERRAGANFSKLSIRLVAFRTANEINSRKYSSVKLINESRYLLTHFKFSDFIDGISGSRTAQL